MDKLVKILLGDRLLS